MSETTGPGYLPGRHAIEGYGSCGFRFAEMSHQGSILILPSGIRAWPVVDIAALTAADLAPVLEEAAELDYVLLGCGSSMAILSAAIRNLFAERAISFDVMPTAAAARTFNVLLAENRRVAAGLIAVP